MSWIDALKHRLRPLVRPAAYDRELKEEFAHHLELDAQAQRASSDRDARRHFGSPTVHREETRRLTLLGWVDVLRQDARYGWRALARSPGFTTVAVISLALGIGANTAVFGLLYSLLLEPLPVPHPDRLMAVQPVYPLAKNGLMKSFPGFRYAEFAELRKATAAGEVSAFTGVGNGVPVEAGDQRAFTSVDLVDGRFFSTIELSPLAGRLINADDDAATAPVAVISDSLWKAFFNRERSALGRTITLRGNTFTIVGVTPANYHGIVFPGRFDIAIPASTATLIGFPALTAPQAPSVLVVSRVASPAAMASAKTSLANTYRSCCADAQLSAGPPAKGKGTARLDAMEISHGIPFGKMDVRGDFGRILVVLMVGVAIVLLIACANVGNLLLARASARTRELAVRLAMGASRARIVRQLLTESAQLALVGGVLGFFLAAWGTGLLLRSVPSNLAMVTGIVAFHPKPALLAFTAVISFACVFVFGLVPALRATRSDLVSSIKERGETRTGRRAGVLDRAIVVAQVALALLLVSSAGLLGMTLRNLRNIDGGFATTHVLMATVDTRGTPYEQGGIVPLHEALLDRVRHISGVRAVAGSTTSPVFGGRMSMDRIQVPGYVSEAGEDMLVPLNAVTPGYFDASGIRLLSGRDFTAGDGATAQNVAIVNETMARAFWAGRDPLGATIRVGGDSGMDLRVVGVARDAKYRDLRGAPERTMYVPLVQSGSWPFVVITARTTGDPQTMAAQLTREVRAVAPELRVPQVEAMEHALDQSLSRERLAAGLAVLFGALALGLAAVGLYGVVGYNVARRTPEIGIRMALGAQRTSVVWFVLRNSLIMVAIGVALGAPLVFFGGKAIAALLYGVGAHDPVLLIGAALLLAATAGLASAIPAMRAARIDPLKALRAG